MCQGVGGETLEAVVTVVLEICIRVVVNQRQRVSQTVVPRVQDWSANRKEKTT